MRSLRDMFDIFEQKTQLMRLLEGSSRAEGVRIAQEMLSAVHPMVQGVQVSAPLSRYALAADVIAGALNPPPDQKNIEGSAVAKL